MTVKVQSTVRRSDILFWFSYLATQFVTILFLHVCCIWQVRFNPPTRQISGDPRQKTVSFWWAFHLNDRRKDHMLEMMWPPQNSGEFARWSHCWVWNAIGWTPFRGWDKSKFAWLAEIVFGACRVHTKRWGMFIVRYLYLFLVPFSRQVVCFFLVSWTFFFVNVSDQKIEPVPFWAFEVARS